MSARPVTYTTRAGDMMDEIAHAHYGSRHGALEAILEANPDIMFAPAELPAAVVLILPPLPDPATAEDIRIFD